MEPYRVGNCYDFGDAEGAWLFMEYGWVRVN